MERLAAMPGGLRRLAVGALVVSLVAGLTSNLLFLAAFQLRLDWFADPARLVAGGPLSASLLRWASILDLVGYYVATAALAYALWRHLRPRNQTAADLSLLGALAYAFAGGAGASVLAMVGPMLMEQYGAASAAEEQFAVLIEAVWRAVWQLFDGIGLAIWWLGLGVLLRLDHRRLSQLTLGLAACALAGVILNVLGLGLGRDAALAVVFALWTAWWIWLLFLLGRPAGAAG